MYIAYMAGCPPRQKAENNARQQLWSVLLTINRFCRYPGLMERRTSNRLGVLRYIEPGYKPQHEVACTAFLVGSLRIF